MHCIQCGAIFPRLPQLRPDRRRRLLRREIPPQGPPQGPDSRAPQHPRRRRSGAPPCPDPRVSFRHAGIPVWPSCHRSRNVDVVPFTRPAQARASAALGSASSRGGVFQSLNAALAKDVVVVMAEEARRRRMPLTATPCRHSHCGRPPHDAASARPLRLKNPPARRRRLLPHAGRQGGHHRPHRPRVQLRPVRPRRPPCRRPEGARRRCRGLRRHRRGGVRLRQWCARSPAP